MADHAARIITALSIPPSDWVRLDSGIVAVNSTWEAAITNLLNSDNKYRSFKWWWAKNYRATKSFLDADLPIWLLHKGTGGASLKPTAHINAVVTELGTPNPSSTSWNGGYTQLASKGCVVVYGSVPMISDTLGNAATVPVLMSQTKLWGTVVGATRKCNQLYASDVGVASFSSGTTTAYKPYAFTTAQLTTTIAVPGNTNVDWRLLTGPVCLTWGEVSPWFTLIGTTNNEALTSMMSGQTVGDPTWRTNSTDAVNSLASRPNDVLIYASRKGGPEINPYYLIPDMKAYAQKVYASDETVDGISLAIVRRNYQAATEFVGVVGAEMAAAAPNRVYQNIDIVAYQDGVVKVTSTTVDGVTTVSTKSLDEILYMIAEHRPLGTVVTVAANNGKYASGAQLASDGMGAAVNYGAIANAISNASMLISSAPRLNATGENGAFGLGIIADCSGLATYKQRTVVNMLVRPEAMTDMRVLATFANAKG